ncbi:hypothetical protein JCM17845_28320 [Iodidimonas gelatinilytica]|uniref:Transmembrane protein n=1 Tax=Iodidimonas gelatinilytica TaxID=1236966 RepID=A0A5A7N579_9PROT|nr:hypothetical protein [Iodidimonas gelatinilytica]GER02209.1 hypothetical protein JCM17845_28320 [Iodidimonas gelatinilytica]
MNRFPLPMPPVRASLTGALVATSVLVLGLDTHEIHLWWLEILRDIDRWLGWTGFISHDDWMYLYNNWPSTAFLKVNSYLSLAVFLFAITTIASWVMLLTRLQFIKRLQEVHGMIEAISLHYINLQHRIPNLEQQADTALWKVNDIVSELAVLKEWLKRAREEPPAGPSPEVAFDNTAASSYPPVREREHMPQFEEEEKEKNYDFDFEL